MKNLNSKSFTSKSLASKSLTSKLFALLVIQMTLVAWFFIAGQQEQNYTQHNLLNLSQTNFDKMIIKENAKELSLVLNKPNNLWTLPEENNLPITSTKITDIIDKLKSLKASWPIATTKASHERFEVAENKFQRQLMFYQGDKLVSEIYLGTSPGFRKIHARLKDKDEVYSLKLNHFEFPTEADDWLDKSLLASDQLSAIKGADFKLVKSSEDWAFAKPDSTQENIIINAVKAKELASALTGLRVQKIAQENPTQMIASIEVETKNEITNNNASLKYDFFTDDKNYFVSRNDINGIFNISQSDFEKLTQFNRASLINLANTQPSDNELSDKQHSKQRIKALINSGDNS